MERTKTRASKTDGNQQPSQTGRNIRSFEELLSMCTFLFQETVAQLLKTHFKDKKTKSTCVSVEHINFDVYPCPMSCLVHSDAIKLAAELLYVYILGNPSVLFVSVNFLTCVLTCSYRSCV